MEMWKPVDGFVGHYEISNLGRVKSLERQGVDGRRIREKILRPTKSQCPYLSVMLVRASSKKRVAVHRMVADAFVKNKFEHNVVNHIDGNKLNNHASNLEWCTHGHNVRHAIQQNLYEKNRHPIQAERPDGTGYFFPSILSAYKHGFTKTLIWACIHGKQITHKGMTWSSLKGISWAIGQGVRFTDRRYG
ncbi:TPA: NUMOD4 motif-containing HNH endonuclease [Klebsiella oxytoca]|nr:NUMOD4 motif-containing HNH endonuclease [Klebsiella oxytoca]